MRPHWAVSREVTRTNEISRRSGLPDHVWVKLCTEGLESFFPTTLLSSVSDEEKLSHFGESRNQEWSYQQNIFLV